MEVTPDAKTAIENFAEYAGMTQTAISTRLVEWFSAQPEHMKNAVLRRYPSEPSIDVPRLILKSMVATQR